MSKAYVLLPDVQYITEAKTRQLITESLNKVLPQGNFKAQSIIFAKKENRYNAFVQTTPEVETKLLQLKNINLGGIEIPTRRCFPQYQVYINKLSDSITKQDIQTYFTQFGKIVDVQLLPAEHMYDNNKGNLNNKLMNINHCYIRFQSQNDVEKCLFSENKHTIRNIDIRAVRAFKIGENDQTDRKLFLKLSPTVQFEVNALQFELYNIFRKYGELREKIKIEQISNSSSKSIITFTSIQGGQKALKQFTLDKIQHYTLTLRPFNSKQNFMVFLSGVKGDVSSQDLKKVLEEYGPVLNCAIIPSKKMNLHNAIATFANEQNFKQVLADYKYNEQFNKFFAGKPFITVHMSAKQRNQYNDYRKKDKKPEQIPVMPMKMNFPFGGYPQQPSMMGGQFGSNMIGQPMGQSIGQPMGLNVNNLNQQMKVPQSYKQ